MTCAPVTIGTDGRLRRHEKRAPTFVDHPHHCPPAEVARELRRTTATQGRLQVHRRARCPAARPVAENGVLTVDVRRQGRWPYAAARADHRRLLRQDVQTFSGPAGAGQLTKMVNQNLHRGPGPGPVPRAFNFRKEVGAGRCGPWSRDHLQGRGRAIVADGEPLQRR